MGEEAIGQGAALAPTWLKERLHALKHDGPTTLLAELGALATTYPTPLMQEKLTYLCKREAQMQYPTYLRNGWPIGSGMAESGNKLVVEMRLKGPGMHWQRGTVNPMLALRTELSSERWAESWEQIQAQWHIHRSQRMEQRVQAALARAAIRVQTTFFRLPLPLLLACFPAPQPPRTPQGRTQAQKQWGRRAFTPRGRELQAEFAKK